MIFFLFLSSIYDAIFNICAYVPVRPRSARVFLIPGLFWFQARFELFHLCHSFLVISHSKPGSKPVQVFGCAAWNGTKLVPWAETKENNSEQQINSQLFYFANRQITLRAKTSINQHAQKKNNVNSAAGSAQQISSWFNTTARIYNPLTDLSHATIAAVTTRHIRTLLKSLQIHPSINPYFYIIPTLQPKTESQRHQCMPEKPKRTPKVNITMYMHKFSSIVFCLHSQTYKVSSNCTY